MKRAIIALFLLIFVSSAASAYDATMNVYLKNTGNETVYVAYAYHPWAGLFFSKTGFGPTRVRGWYELEPGEQFRICSIDWLEQATFVFSKRDGSIIYQPSGLRRADIGIDSVYVHPTDAFDYTGQASAGTVLVKRAFALAIDASGDGELDLYLSIPSKTSDVVTPFPTAAQ